MPLAAGWSLVHRPAIMRGCPTDELDCLVSLFAVLYGRVLFLAAMLYLHRTFFDSLLCPALRRQSASVSARCCVSAAIGLSLARCAVRSVPGCLA